MNAEDFYERVFKGSLAYLGVAWGDKHLVEVKLFHNRVQFSYGGMIVTTEFDQEEK